MSDPAISVVMAARNDDHGGNMLQRMRLSIDTLGQLCREYRLDIELIVVEWNPPDGRFYRADRCVGPAEASLWSE